MLVRPPRWISAKVRPFAADEVTYLLHALSPLHAGTGQSVGLIDLPIARLRATNIPYVPGSSLKGVLREARRSLPPEEWEALFGPLREPTGHDDHGHAATSAADAHAAPHGNGHAPVRPLGWHEIAGLAPLALQHAKRVLNDDGAIEEASSVHKELFDKAWASQDVVEAQAARVEKRPPKFRGA